MSLMRTISWPGAKYRALDSLLRWCPVTPFGAMCEPFFGSGALTLALAGQIEGPVFIAEANSALRNWWRWALADVDALLARTAEFRAAWASAGVARDRFDAMRQTWNDMAREEPTAMDTAALLWTILWTLGDEPPEPMRDDDGRLCALSETPPASMDGVVVVLG